MRVRTLLPVAVLLAVVAEPRTAISQDAVALFEQGRALVAQQKWAAACPLFNEAHRMQKEAIGIAMNLGECYAHTGKTASAWSAFREAEFQAKKQNDPERAQYAHQQAALLEPRLSRLQIDAAPTPGLIIHRDEQEIGAGVLGTAFPIDPGSHKIEATAPGYRVWSTTVVIGAERDQQSVQIPTLGKGPSGADVDGKPDAGPHPFAWTKQRAAGIAVGGLGVLTLGAGGALGGLAISKNNASKAGCGLGAPNACNPAGLSARQSAGTFADASTGLLAAGGALVVVGVAVFAAAPSHPATTGGPARFEVAPAVGMGTAGLSFRGEW